MFPKKGIRRGRMKEIFMKGIVLTVLILIPVSTFSDYRQDIPIIDWIAAYNYPGNSSDIANALAVDHAGNVYVTGSSYSVETNHDYAIIKYDKHGNQLWVERYNGPGNSVDVANALTVDHAGNVYVTGYSDELGTFSVYTTIKYNMYVVK